MEQVRWGILGCGDVTEVKSGPALREVPGSSVVAVMRRDAAKAQDYARRHGVQRWYDDPQKLIHDPAVNAVYVATPPGSHREYALAVAAAGKHCYVEKPMARTAGECADMVEAFRQTGRKLFVAYYRRALPAFVKAKELIETGAIGRVSAVSYRLANATHRRTPEQNEWRLQPEIAGAGLFLDLGSHLLDALDYILGPLQDVRGVAANVGRTYAAEDVVAMHFRTPGGAPGTGLWNFASDLGEDIIEITGTEGRVSWACFGNGTLLLQRRGQSETFELPPPRHVQRPLIERIIADLQNRDTCPSTGQSALRTSAVMDRVLEDYYPARGDDRDWNLR